MSLSDPGTSPVPRDMDGRAGHVVPAISTSLLDVWYTISPVEVEPCLDAIEAAASRKLVHERDRRRSIRTHSLKRRILAGQYLDTSPDALEFRRRMTGKPYLSTSSLEFNVSHSEEAFALAVSTHPVGVDIQWMDPCVDFRGVASVAFHPAEAALWRLEGATDDLFYRLWAAKEAVMKAEGTGFLRAPSGVDVSDWTDDHCRAWCGGRQWAVTARQVGRFALCVATPANAGLEAIWRPIGDAPVLPGRTFRTSEA